MGWTARLKNCCRKTQTTRTPQRSQKREPARDWVCRRVLWDHRNQVSARPCLLRRRQWRRRISLHALALPWLISLPQELCRTRLQHPAPLWARLDSALSQHSLLHQAGCLWLLCGLRGDGPRWLLDRRPQARTLYEAMTRPPQNTLARRQPSDQDRPSRRKRSLLRRGAQLRGQGLGILRLLANPASLLRRGWLLANRPPRLALALQSRSLPLLLLRLLRLLYQAVLLKRTRTSPWLYLPLLRPTSSRRSPTRHLSP
jgi:hypothetical protein